MGYQRLGTARNAKVNPPGRYAPIYAGLNRQHHIVLNIFLRQYRTYDIIGDTSTHIYDDIAFKKHGSAAAYDFSYVERNRG